MSAAAVFSLNMIRNIQSAGRTSPITGIIWRYDELLQLVRVIYCCAKRWQELNREAVAAPLNLSSIPKLLEAWLGMSLSHACFSVLSLPLNSVCLRVCGWLDAGSHSLSIYIYIYMLQVMNMQGCGSKQGSWKQTRSCSYLCLTRKTTGRLFPWCCGTTVSWAQWAKYITQNSGSAFG